MWQLTAPGPFRLLMAVEGQQSCYGPVVFVGSFRLTVCAHCV